jgi:hypothetical protein
VQCVPQLGAPGDDDDDDYDDDDKQSSFLISAENAN